MKKVIVSLALFAVTAVMAQEPPALQAEPVTAAVAQEPQKQSAVVYMAGEEPSAVRGAFKVLGLELAKALTNSTNYIAVDRTYEAIKILAAADIFKKDGAIDVNKAKLIGTQLAAQVVCVAEITEVLKSYYLDARLVNVETAEISKVASGYGDMNMAEEVVRIAQNVAAELVSRNAKTLDYSIREIMNNPRKAIADYTDAIRKDPKVRDYYLKRAIAYSRENEDERAIADINQAIQITPNDYELYHRRGFLYEFSCVLKMNTPDNVRRDCFDRVIADYSYAIRLKPDAISYFLRGSAYYNTGVRPPVNKNYVDKAIADFNKAIELNPNFENTYMSRGLAYIQKGDPKRGLADFNQLIRLNPSTSSYSQRALAYMVMGDYDKALADYSNVIQMDPNSSDAYAGRANVYMLKGDYDRGIADYNQAIRIYQSIYHNAVADNNDRATIWWHSSRLSSLYNGRGMMYQRKGDTNRATADFNQAKIISASGQSAPNPSNPPPQPYPR